MKYTVGKKLQKLAISLKLTSYLHYRQFTCKIKSQIQKKYDTQPSMQLLAYVHPLSIININPHQCQFLKCNVKL